MSKRKRGLIPRKSKKITVSGTSRFSFEQTFYGREAKRLIDMYRDIARVSEHRFSEEVGGMIDWMEVFRDAYLECEVDDVEIE